MKRRTLLKISSAAAGLGLVGLSLNELLQIQNKSKNPKTLVFVMLSGGMDALSLLYPGDEKNLEAQRPSILLRKDQALDWNGYVVHPLLAQWQPLWEQKKLSFIHQFGAPSSRSHSEAVDYSQTFHPSTSRHEASLLKIMHDHKVCELEDYTSAVYFTALRPKLFTGPVRPMKVAGQFLGPLTDLRGPIGFESDILNSYKNSGLPVEAEGLQELMKKRRELKVLLDPLAATTHGSSYLRNQFDTLANLMTVNFPVKVAFIESLRWDTHARQGVHNGTFHDNLSDLASSVSSFIQKIGSRIDDTLIVIHSEFGRTVAENGSQATDHGTGGLCMLLGGGHKGGKVHGPWAELKPENLFEGRDLPVQTDIRDFWGHLLQGYFGKDLPANIFPDYKFKKLGFDLF